MSALRRIGSVICTGRGTPTASAMAALVAAMAEHVKGNDANTQDDPNPVALKPFHGSCPNCYGQPHHAAGASLGHGARDGPSRLLRL